MNIVPCKWQFQPHKLGILENYGYGKGQNNRLKFEVRKFSYQSLVSQVL